LYFGGEKRKKTKKIKLKIKKKSVVKKEEMRGLNEANVKFSEWQNVVKN
jgi:hypothetical protein